MLKKHFSRLHKNQSLFLGCERLLDDKFKPGYTKSMKTAISLPDNLFKEAETYARRLKKSRSQLYVDALIEYLSHHSPDTITEAMNKVCDSLDEQETSFVSKASRKVLISETW